MFRIIIVGVQHKQEGVSSWPWAAPVFNTRVEEAWPVCSIPLSEMKWVIIFPKTVPFNLLSWMRQNKTYMHAWIQKMFYLSILVDFTRDITDILVYLGPSGHLCDAILQSKTVQGTNIFLVLLIRFLSYNVETAMQRRHLSLSKDWGVKYLFFAVYSGEFSLDCGSQAGFSLSVPNHWPTSPEKQQRQLQIP